MQYLFNIQRQFGSDWLLEAGYLGGESHHLHGFQDANQGFPGTTGAAPSAVSLLQLRHHPTGARWRQRELQLAEHQGHAPLQRGLERDQFLYMVRSRSTTPAASACRAYDTLFPQNSYCIRCERGLSSFDVRSRFVTSVLYDLPDRQGQACSTSRTDSSNGIVGGWQSGGIFTMQSGLPGTLSIGGVDNAGTGARWLRPSELDRRQPLCRATEPPSRWFNPAAFTEAPPGQFGNVGRNTIDRTRASSTSISRCTSSSGCRTTNIIACSSGSKRSIR